MKPKRRFDLALVAVFVCLALLTLLPVSGVVKGPASDLKSRLEVKYGLKITGEGNLLTGKDAQGYLNAFDKGMSLFGAPFIKELVAIYRKAGTTPIVKFSKYTGRDREDAFYDWDDGGVVIGLMVESPYSGKPALGLAPQTITHEIGHLIYYGICEKYGEEKFERDWTAVNDGIPYREGNPYPEWEEDEAGFDSGEQAVPAGELEEAEDGWDEEADYSYIYVSEYAATDAFEDFAEIIAYILTEPERVRKLTEDPRGAVLKAKVDFIEKTLKEYFTTFKGFFSWGYPCPGAEAPFS
ncbi:MAG: putative zinc-binding metallopeptidase [Firmicutes bacterium]|nr:putative zinc-binding metallopeptidase [Bacillota bacterium]